MSEAMEYVKLPVSVEVMQWTGNNISDIWEWAGADNIYGPTERNVDQLIVLTLEDGGDIPEDEIIEMRGQRYRAKHVADLGDWIIKGVVGEFYACKPEIFEKTYRKLVDNPRKVDLLNDGLLWYFNRTALHARGYALAVDAESGELTLYGNGQEVWHFGEAVDEDDLKQRFDAMLTRTDSVPDDE
jgi:hypothetical protein